MNWNNLGRSAKSWTRPAPAAMVVLAVMCLPNTLQAQLAAPRANQQRGAVTGGIAGAVAGGLIGDNNGKAGAGAAIGGVLGAVAGGIFGNAKDQEQNFRRSQQQFLQQQRQAAVVQSSVTIADVVSMSRSGLGENVIINQIQSRGVLSQPQVADIIAMHQQGVSERVITAMQQAPTGPQAAARAAAASQQGQRVYSPAPVYIQERVVLPHYPVPVYHHYHGGRGYYRSHGRAGVHVRF